MATTPLSQRIAKRFRSIPWNFCSSRSISNFFTQCSQQSTFRAWNMMITIDRCDQNHRMIMIQTNQKRSQSDSASANYFEKNSAAAMSYPPLQDPSSIERKTDRQFDVNPRNGMTFSRQTFQRRKRAHAQPWYITADHLEKIKHPFPTSVSWKLPIEERVPSAPHMMDILRMETRTKIHEQYPRYIEKFNAGDQILVTLYISLQKAKFERLYGVCLSRSGSNSLTASFVLRVTKLDEPYELTIPLHSPFVREIKVLKRSTSRHRMKKYFIRNLPPENTELSQPSLTGYSELEVEEIKAEHARRAEVAKSVKKRK